MQINGKMLQGKLLKELDGEINKLRDNRVNPKIAIVTLGPEESWEAYVSQKIKLAAKLKIEVEFINLRPNTTEEVIIVIDELNNNNTIHGIIVQRPFPPEIETEKVIKKVSAKKDIDGFLTDSSFEVPAFLAVKHILSHVAEINKTNLLSFLSKKSIVVVGKGGTAGGPIIQGIKKLGFKPIIVDSRTKNAEEIFKNADVIISAVGKKNIIPIDIIKNGCVLIGVGIHGEDGKLIGDFDQTQLDEKGIIYTPTPGGVGPVNLAYLFKNLVKAAKNQA